MEAPSVKFATLSQFYVLILSRVLVYQSISVGRYVSNLSMQIRKINEFIFYFFHFLLQCVQFLCMWKVLKVEHPTFLQV